MVSHIPIDSLRLAPPQTVKQHVAESSDYPYYTHSESDYVSKKPVLEFTNPLVDEVIKDRARNTVKPARLSAGCWAKDKLRKLGFYHPLEPSHVSFPRSDLAATLERLTRCFKMLSCRVLYEDELLSAACLTMEQVEFQVSLYESRQDQQTVLLELQRRTGDSYVFHQDYAQPILAAAQGQELSGHLPSKRMCGISMDRLAKHAGVSDEDVDVAIELATNLVTADRLDACRLGMESLVTLTDASKTGMSTARKVARELVMPSGGTSEKLMHAMVKYLLSTEASEDLIFHALQVWANAWQLAADDMETPLDSFCDVACDRETLLNSLMDRVENVGSEPHQATLALQGLAALCREMPHLRGSVSWRAVEQANAVGESENAALELASRKFLDAR